MTYLLQSEYFAENSPSKEKPARARKRPALRVAGPSLYEISYLEQVAEELNIFLHSKGFSTIDEIQLGIAGTGYRAQLKIAR